MTLDQDLAWDYLASSAPWLWDWKENGEVVSWSQGATIAFRPEIGALIARLETLGLPRFGAIVLLAAASRDSWNSETSGRNSLEEILARFHAPTESYLLLADVLEGLDRVHELRDLLVSPAAKAELAAFVFEAAKYRWPAESTAAVLRAFANGVTPTTFIDPETDPLDAILSDLADLRSGLALVDRASLERRLKTGLDQAVVPAPLELPPGVAARELIQRCADDDELGGVARLARLLLAAVQLPRPLHDPEELPVGGVTDITNRGPLDRLMLGELAHDDLTLAVRVAMNEALYLRREPLPRAISRQRFVLLDSGLRLWGVPRVFATAVGLAIAAQANKQIEVLSWRACGKRIVPVDFTTEQGLKDHLAALDHRVHPGDSLPAFAELIQSATIPSDALIITSQDVLADREFSQQLENINLASVHVATVEREGRFQLLLRSRRGSKKLREAIFPLEQVLAPRPKRTTPLVDTRGIPGMPAIYGVQPFPLRLSVSVRPENSWRVTPGGYTLTLTNDGRLLRWDSKDLGAREIACGLPAGQIHACSKWPDRDGVTVVVGKLSKRGLYAVQISFESGAQSVRSLNLSAEQPRLVTIHHGTILVIFAKQVDAFSPATGGQLDTRQNPYGLAKWGRFVRLEHGARFGSIRWAAISFDGTSIQFAVLDRPTAAAPPLLAVFESIVMAGPVGVTATADLIDLTTDLRVPIPIHRSHIPCSVQAVSRDGMRILLGGPNETGTKQNILVELPNLKTEFVYGDPLASVECLTDFVALRWMRRRFRGILVDEVGRLTLVSKKGSLWPISQHAQRNEIVFPKLPSGLNPRGEVLPFESIDESSAGGRSLSVARWPDGSIAVLDSVGMLHLRSSDRAIPECSIVLREGTTSGWVSNGWFWGEPYFVGQNPVTLANVVYEAILERFINRVRK